MHGAGTALRTLLLRANTWQRAAIAVALIAIGSVLVAFGDPRAGLIGVVGVLLLVGTVRNRSGRRRHTTAPATAEAAPTRPGTTHTADTHTADKEHL